MGFLSSGVPEKTPEGKRRVHGKLSMARSRVASHPRTPVGHTRSLDPHRQGMRSTGLRSPRALAPLRLPTIGSVPRTPPPPAPPSSFLRRLDSGTQYSSTHTATFAQPWLIIHGTLCAAMAHHSNLALTGAREAARLGLPPCRPAAPAALAGSAGRGVRDRRAADGTRRRGRGA